MKRINLCITSNLNSWSDKASRGGEMCLCVNSSLNYWKDSILPFQLCLTNFNYDKCVSLNFNYDFRLVSGKGVRGPPVAINRIPSCSSYSRRAN
jgi:hypothetical protein